MSVYKKVKIDTPILASVAVVLREGNSGEIFVDVLSSGKFM